MQFWRKVAIEQIGTTCNVSVNFLKLIMPHGIIKNIHSSSLLVDVESSHRVDRRNILQLPVFLFISSVSLFDHYRARVGLLVSWHGNKLIMQFQQSDGRYQKVISHSVGLSRIVAFDFIASLLISAFLPWRFEGFRNSHFCPLRKRMTFIN